MTSSARCDHVWYVCAYEHLSALASNTAICSVSVCHGTAYTIERQAFGFAVLRRDASDGINGLGRTITAARAYPCSCVSAAVKSRIAVRTHRIRSRRAWRRKVHANIITLAYTRGTRGLIPGVLANPVASAACRSIMARVVFLIATTPHTSLPRIGTSAAALCSTVATVWFFVKEIHTFAQTPPFVFGNATTAFHRAIPLAVAKISPILPCATLVCAVIGVWILVVSEFVEF